ncbi:13673_t:CDS:2 [Dentiscutata erythropus]|uniref:13673_t:CDS:1 n=1 Tax=Dentiscutata erythropus TaxID=1348616 RepID=A0A9N9ECS4_9GLOM|nr:13673_t:CDS:2 [Dentiscutata erythropus]
MVNLLSKGITYTPIYSSFWTCCLVFENKYTYSNKFLVLIRSMKMIYQVRQAPLNSHRASSLSLLNSSLFVMSSLTAIDIDEEDFNRFKPLLQHLQRES